LSSRDETIALNSLASASRRKRAEKSNIRPARTMPPNRRRTLELKNNPYFNDDAPDLDYDDDDDRSGAPIRTFLVVLLTLLLTGTLVLLFFQNQKLNASTAGKAASEQLATLQQEITTLKLENEALQAQLSKRTDTQANGETPEEDTYLAPDDTTPEQTTTGQNNSNASSNANQTSTTNASGQTVHTVASGETLSKISQKYYGTPNQYYKIQEANKISDEDAGTIQAGMTLIIP
jgi:LysM repeat protein